MNLKTISTISRARALRWHKGIHSWSTADWSNAMAGEAAGLGAPAV